MPAFKKKGLPGVKCNSDTASDSCANLLSVSNCASFHLLFNRFSIAI